MRYRIAWDLDVANRMRNFGFCHSAPPGVEKKALTLSQIRRRGSPETMGRENRASSGLAQRRGRHLRPDCNHLPLALGSQNASVGVVIAGTFKGRTTVVAGLLGRFWIAVGHEGYDTSAGDERADLGADHCADRAWAVSHLRAARYHQHCARRLLHGWH